MSLSLCFGKRCLAIWIHRATAGAAPHAHTFTLGPLQFGCGCFRMWQD